MIIDDSKVADKSFFCMCAQELRFFIHGYTESYYSVLDSNVLTCFSLYQQLNNNNYYSPKLRWLAVDIYRILSPSSCISGTACLIIREISLFVTAAIYNKLL